MLQAMRAIPSLRSDVTIFCRCWSGIVHQGLNCSRRAPAWWMIANFHLPHEIVVRLHWHEAGVFIIAPDILLVKRKQNALQHLHALRQLVKMNQKIFNRSGDQRGGVRVQGFEGDKEVPSSTRPYVHRQATGMLSSTAGYVSRFKKKLRTCWGRTARPWPLSPPLPFSFLKGSVRRVRMMSTFSRMLSAWSRARCSSDG